MRHLSVILLLLCSCAPAWTMGDLPPLYKLAYVKQPRVEEMFSPWQHRYDGSLMDRHTPSYIEINNRKGGIIRLHEECVTSLTLVCAAQDPDWSPDGSKLLYTLVEGNRLYPVKTWGEPKDQLLTPPIEFGLDANSPPKYSLWIYDVASGKSSKLEDNARQGKWYNAAAIVFSSNRANVYTPWSYAGPEQGYMRKALHPYIADIVDGRVTNVLDLSPESVGSASPAGFPDGQVCWSEFDGWGERGKMHTPSNMLWIKCSRSNGTNAHIVMGAHGSTTIKTREYLGASLSTNPQFRGEGATQIKLPRGIVPLRGREYALTWYYRNNHQGMMGIICGAEFLDNNVEGFSAARWIAEADYPKPDLGSGRYTAQVHCWTPYAQDQDMSWPKANAQNRANGKAGYPHAAPPGEGEMIATWCEGACYEGTLPGTTRAMLGGAHLSKSSIVMLKQRRVLDPWDTAQQQIIACPEEDVNCWDGVSGAPYEVLYGVSPPQRLAVLPPTGETRLHVVNARAAELTEIPSAEADYIRQDNKCTFQGCTAGAGAAAIAYIRITEYIHHTTPPKAYGWATGRVWRCPLEGDGSVACAIPAGIVYLLQGDDVNGNGVAFDKSLHFARDGETVTCHGCHDGHSVERAAWLKQTAEQRFPMTMAGKTLQPAQK